jgi:hypothetical protein
MKAGIPIFFLAVSLCLNGNTRALGQLDSTTFRHHVIANPLPGAPTYGTGGFTLADFDGDGDLDVTISRRSDSTRCNWYENKSGTWLRHIIGKSDPQQLGAASADINNDGFPDLIMGRMWFQNPGNLASHPDTPWIQHLYAGGLSQENHDIVISDFNSDNQPDVVCYGQRDGDGVLRWYDTSDPLNWKWHTIAEDINKATLVKRPSSHGLHGGFAPAGVGDLNNDKFPDIVMPTGWYRNPGTASADSWTLVPWPFHLGLEPNLYGISIRSWVCDLDADGDTDIVLTDCDVEGSAGYWIENINDGKKFVLHPLPSPKKPTGSFHSLAVADFDLDGDLDIFSGEQEDPNPGMKDRSLKERGFFWENIGDAHHPAFKLNIIHVDNPGWHEVQVGDVDGDGDPDLVSKIWNKDGTSYHADYWENLRR